MTANWMNTDYGEVIKFLCMSRDNAVKNESSHGKNETIKLKLNL
jgi:hypothetical protein